MTKAEVIQEVAILPSRVNAGHNPAKKCAVLLIDGVKFRSELPLSPSHLEKIKKVSDNIFFQPTTKQ